MKIKLLLFCIIGVCLCVSSLLSQEKEPNKNFAAYFTNHNNEFLFQYYTKIGDQLYKNHDLKNNLKLALKYYRQALTLNYRQNDIYWRIARLLWIEQERELASSRKKELLEEALVYLRKGEKINPDNIDLKLWSAIVNGSYLIHNNFLQAILFLKDDVKSNLEFVIQNDAKSVRAVFALGSYYQLLPEIFGGNPNKTLELFQQSLKLNPNFHRVRLSLAEIYIQNQQLTRAKEVLLPVLKAKEWEEVGYSLEYKKQAKELLSQVEPDLTF